MTIGIASYQRRQPLATLLESILEAVAEATGQAEVLVVLDGSDDGSRELVAEMAVASSVPIRSVWQPNQGLAATRNTIAREALADVVWLLDDDMIVNRAAFERHLGHDRTTSPFLMGPYEIRATDTMSRRLAPFFDARHRRLAPLRVVTSPSDMAFANTSAPTRLLCEFPFDERFKGYGLEDYELALRVLRAGHRIEFDMEAAIEHRCQPTEAERLRTQRESGVNRVRFVEIHPDQVDVAFDPHPSGLERVLRKVARPVAAWPLRGLARATQVLAGRWGDKRRGGWKIYSTAELIATYSGVASAGGVPDSR